VDGRIGLKAKPYVRCADLREYSVGTSRKGRSAAEPQPKRRADILVRSVGSGKIVDEILIDLDRSGVAADKNVRAPTVWKTGFLFTSFA
jgi:hypothetical protein